jgi:hypothetical protein
VHHHPDTSDATAHRRRPSRRAVVAGLLLAGSLVPATASLAVPPRAAVLIPDQGLPAELQPTTMSTRTEVMAAGVTGVSKVGDTESALDTPVLAFAQWNDIVFVGGKFTNVQRGTGAPLQSQSYLAAFDRSTGTWIDSFRPRLDGTVWDMAVVGNTLIVGGQFTNVNGVANTSALAALDPATGQVIPGWRANVVLTGSNARPMVRAIDVEGSWVYIGGNFTRVTGPDGVTRSVGRMARVAVSNGAPSAGFAPNIGGTIYDIDATPSRIYAVGKFTTVNGITQSMFTSLFPSNGAVDTALRQKVDSDYDPNRTYQQAVLSMGSEVWISGSQHDTQVYRASDFSLIRNFGSVPWGDGQALATTGGRVYYGSHANDSTLMYSDPPAPIYTRNGWNTRGSTRADPVKWIGSWDASGDHRFIAEWYPQVGTQYGEGAWELFVDSVGCLWAGGDFNRGSFDGNVARYVGGFAKFCPGDGIAPTVPTDVSVSLRADGVQLVWPASTDERPGPISYDIFRDDTLIASGLTNRTFLDPAGVAGSRYFVRAVDQAGNRSATTSVLLAQDGSSPSAPTGLQATLQPNNDVVLSWSPSNDDVGVTGYVVVRNGVDVQTVGGTSATVTGQTAGTWAFQVAALDAAGNRSATSSAVQVTINGTDTTKPSTPRDLQAAVQPNNDALLTWTAATDNVGVAAYAVYRNNVELFQVPDTTATVSGLPAGTWYLQVQAIDTSGNRGNKTSPVAVTVVGADTAKPSSPQNLQAAVQPNGEIVATWSASNDNVGVTAYAVYRNNVELFQVSGTTATITGLGAGNHYLQVQAIDAAGNRSNKTSPLLVVK